tara:strand:- start:324 stop:563 length:240 start_codon:yes stop_codon:yes gene_type:complete
MGRKEKDIKIIEIDDLIGPKLPTTGPYKLRRPWQKWTGGPYKKPKTTTYEFGGKKYEFKKGGSVRLAKRGGGRAYGKNS